MKYIFDTHYGVSTLTDVETGMILKWDNGDFERHRHYTMNMDTIALIVPCGEDEESFITAKEQEMDAYVIKNYPETI